MGSTRHQLELGNRRFRILPLANLVKAEWNYKKEDDALASKLIANIKRNGQVENLLVRQLKPKQWEVVNGNHRLDALRTLKLKGAVVCDLGKISQREAKRLAIETNETKFETDFVKLSTLLKDIKLDFADDDLLTTMPFDARELSDIEQITTFEWTEPDRKKKSAAINDGNGAAEGRIAMTLNFTAQQTNLLNAFVVRSGKRTPEEAILWAIGKI